MIDKDEYWGKELKAYDSTDRMSKQEIELIMKLCRAILTNKYSYSVFVNDLAEKVYKMLEQQGEQ